MTFLWTEDMPGETVRKWVGINKNTIVDWFNFCREVCAVYMDQIETEKIGGVGKVVEIDESKFGKRKYNRGRRREGQWVLGGVERGSDEMFMQIVPSRDAATLLPVISRGGSRILGKGGSDKYIHNWGRVREGARPLP